MNPPDPPLPPPKPKTTFTPLKIRGKKTNITQQAPATTKHRLTDMADQSNPSKRPRRTKPRRAGSALIEQLPLEILEHIFLLSKNVHFPQSSPFIGCALSSRLTLLRLVVEAFGPTWDVWFGCRPETVHSYSGWQRDEKRIGGDPKFQTDVLACRRVDMSVLLDAQKLWLGRQTAPRLLDMPPFNPPALRTPYIRKYLSEPWPPVGCDEPATSEDVERCFEWEWKCHVAWCDAMATLGARVKKDFIRPMAENLGFDFGVKKTQEEIDASSRSVMESCLRHQGEIDDLYGEAGDRIDSVFEKANVARGPGSSYEALLWVYSMPSSIGIHPKVRIPDSLLVGPLDWAKAKLLFWYTRQGAQLDGQHTWELTVLGYKNLTKLDDPKLRLVVIGLFVHLRVFNFWPPHPRGSAVHNAILKMADAYTTEEAAQWAILFMAIVFPSETLAEHNERDNNPRRHYARRALIAPPPGQPDDSDDSDDWY